jgi:exodeoxyribonuclease VII small subunit
MSKGRELSYSTALEELEGIVESIEAEEVDVDVLSEKVKRAAELISFCRTRLKSTEEEIKKTLTTME